MTNHNALLQWIITSMPSCVASTASLASCSGISCAASRTALAARASPILPRQTRATSNLRVLIHILARLSQTFWLKITNIYLTMNENMMKSIHFYTITQPSSIHTLWTYNMRVQRWIMYAVNVHVSRCKEICVHNTINVYCSKQVCSTCISHMDVQYTVYRDIFVLF